MATTRREWLACAAATAAAASAGPALGATGANPVSVLSDVLADLVRSGRCAGAALGVSARSAPQLRAFGAANLETGTPLVERSVFRIASCTKQFTAAAIMLLVEAGKIGVADPVEKYFPGFPDGPSGGKATIQNLLSHTSGIHDYVFGGLPPDAGELWRYDADPVRFIKRMSPLYDFAPGEAWNYSNTNYAILGELIGKLSGKSYQDFLHDRIFKPLGMVQTALDHAEDIVVGRVSGYSLAGGRPGSFSNAKCEPLPTAEGGLRSTVGDLLRWSAALHGGHVVSGESLRQMIQPALLRNGASALSNRYTPPGQRRGNPPPFVERDDYGFGLQITRMFGQEVFWHNGGISGFSSLLFHIPDRSVDVAILTNTDNAAMAQFEKVARATVLGTA